MLWAAVAVLMAAVAFVAGRELGSENDVPSAFDRSAVAYEAADLPVAFTTGRFTGFGESGLEGRTTISGRVASVEGGVLTLETSAGLQSVRMNSDHLVRRFETATREAVRPGVAVVVLLKPDSEEAQSLLVLAE
jgi:hypothetical protein